MIEHISQKSVRFGEGNAFVALTKTSVISTKPALLKQQRILNTTYTTFIKLGWYPQLWLLPLLWPHSHILSLSFNIS